MNRRLAVCCAALVLLATACAETVRGSAAGAAGSAALPTVVNSTGSIGSSSAEDLSSAATAIDVTTGSGESEPGESEPSGSESRVAGTSESASSESASSESASGESLPASTTDVDRQLPEPKPDPPRNSFGDIAAEPARSYGVDVGTTDDASPALVFRVRALTVDPTCADGAPKPRNGHYLLIDLQVEPRAMTDEQVDAWYGTFSHQGWVAFDSEGGPQTGIDTDEAEECLPDKRFPSLSGDELAGADGLITGVVVLDVVDPSGTVLLDLSTGEKWEFSYPG